ncbi:hypothetical protein ACVW2K_001466 [Nocardioides sp. HB32]
MVPGVEGSLTDSGAGEVAMTEQRPAEPAREGTELTLLRLTADIAEELVGIDGLDRAAQHTADLVARRGVADVVGLSVHSRHGPARRLGSSDAGLAALDRVASASLMTPRDVLLADGEVLVLPATREEARWPEWAAATATAGLHSALFVGMPPARTDVTVLELYGRRPGAFPPAATRAASHLAHQIGLLLRHVDRATNLTAALNSRGVVGQAQGMLMERYELDGDQAMAVLRRHSQETQLKLHTVAELVVAGRRLHAGRADDPSAPPR